LEPRRARGGSWFSRSSSNSSHDSSRCPSTIWQRTYGVIRAALEKDGKIIGPNDMFIGAIALANEFTLVTHNTAEFNRVPGLIVEDWET
jgi:predicted nucleic acid-binding protein